MLEAIERAREAAKPKEPLTPQPAPWPQPKEEPRSTKAETPSDTSQEPIDLESYAASKTADEDIPVIPKKRRK